jgi:hypothetical protein
VASHPGCAGSSKKHIVYHFEFVDGRVIDGCATSNDTPVAGFADTFHVSCSDVFPGGFGVKGSPVQALGEPQILNYSIVHFDVKNGVETEKKRCGEVFGTAAGTLTIEVTKTNDANGDGAFNDTEQAPQAGASVPFRAVITNTGTSALVIDSIVDAFSGTTLNVCGDLLGDTLQPGQSVTCLFTVPAYAPAPGGTLPDTVTVVGHDAADPTKTATDSDDSSVTTPGPTVIQSVPPPPPGSPVTPPAVQEAGGVTPQGRPAQRPAPDVSEAPAGGPLAFTGFDAALILLVTVGLLVLGTGSLGLGRRRARKSSE